MTGSSARVDDLPTRLQRATDRRLRAAAPLLRRARARLPTVQVRCDLTGQSAGQARWLGTGEVHIRYNLALARQQPAVFLDEVVAHEVAHVVTQACYGRVRPHGTEWRQVMTFFGFPEPQRCHRFDTSTVAVRRQQRWRYRCGCREHALTTVRHRRLQAGTQRYQCRACAQPLVWTGESENPS